MISSIILIFVLCASNVKASPSANCRRSVSPAPNCASEEFMTRAIERAVAAAIAQTVKDCPTTTPAPALSPSKEIASDVTAAVIQAIKDLIPPTTPASVTQRCDCDERVASAVAPFQLSVQYLTRSLAELTQREAQRMVLTMTPAAPQCVSDYEYSNVTGHCYKLHTEEVNWSVANETCYEEGGLLAVVNSRDEALLLRDFRKRAAYACFIGVYKDSDGDWVTSTGEEVVAAAGHHVWSGNEPWRGNEWERGVIYDDGTIGTTKLETEHPFICERAA